MNRRKFIKRSLIFTSIPVVGFSAYEGFVFFHYPDYKYLVKSKPLIAEICETIIPRTDTPGAKDAHVEDYVIDAVRKNLSRIDTNKFIDGLKEMDNYCKSHFKKNFRECDQKERIAALEDAENSEMFHTYPRVKKIKKRITGDSFSDLFKSLTTIGYCTSKLGATLGLAYDHIPVNYMPCIPLRKGQKSWATK